MRASRPAEATLGRVIAELAGELDRIHTRRDALAAEIEEVPRVFKLMRAAQ